MHTSAPIVHNTLLLVFTHLKIAFGSIFINISCQPYTFEIDQIDMNSDEIVTKMYKEKFPNIFTCIVGLEVVILYT